MPVAGSLSCHAEIAKNPPIEPRWTREGVIPLSSVQSLYVVELKLSLRTRLAHQTYARRIRNPVEKSIASVVLRLFLTEFHPVAESSTEAISCKWAQARYTTVSRALKSIGWSKKTCRRVAKGRNADLRDYYLHELSAFSLLSPRVCR